MLNLTLKLQTLHTHEKHILKKKKIYVTNSSFVMWGMYVLACAHLFTCLKFLTLRRPPVHQFLENIQPRTFSFHTPSLLNLGKCFSQDILTVTKNLIFFLKFFVTDYLLFEFPKSLLSEVSTWIRNKCDCDLWYQNK